MTEMKKYVFRDNEVFLEMLDGGSRSKFIRDSIQSKIKSCKNTYNEEIREDNQLIEYYISKINTYYEEIEELNKEKTKIEQLKDKSEKRLKKLIHEQNNKKNLLQQKIQEKKNEKLTQIRETIIEELISNLLRQKEDKNRQTLNLDYLVKKGEYENIKELKTELIIYINNLKYDSTSNQEISEKDIEYLKTKIRSN